RSGLRSGSLPRLVTSSPPHHSTQNLSPSLPGSRSTMHPRFPVFGSFFASALTLVLAAGFPPLLGTLPAQPATDLIHYPFLLNSGTTVRNIAPPTNNPVPATGTFVSTN